MRNYGRFRHYWSALVVCCYGVTSLAGDQAQLAAQEPAYEILSREGETIHPPLPSQQAPPSPPMMAPRVRALPSSDHKKTQLTPKSPPQVAAPVIRQVAA